MLDVLFHATEVNIQFMEMLQKGAERRSFRHLRKGVDILGEAFATITKLTVRTGHISVGIIDVAREEHSRMYLAPIATHLLAILTTGIEISHLVSSKHIVHIFGQLSLQRSHDGKLLANKDLCEQFMRTSEHHSLPLEVLDKRTFSEKLWHIAHLMLCLTREHIAGSRKNSGSDKNGDVWQGG